MTGTPIEGRPRAWDHLYWGVLFKNHDPAEAPILLGEGWAESRPWSFAGEAPPRALQFRTRRAAQAWCNERNRAWRTRNDILRHWRVRPVRVRETVRMTGP